MKKRVLYVLSLITLAVILTGCVNLNVNMEVKKDKSMDLSFTITMNEEYYTDPDENELKFYTDKGFNASKYTEGSKKGYKFSKNIENIDGVSSTDDVSVTLANLMGTEESKDDNLFKIKKGFLKNTYTVKITDVSATDSNMFTDFGSTNENGNTDFNGNSLNVGTEESDSSFDSSQITNMMTASMDLSFTINLPYAAKSSNGTAVNGDDMKSLKWDLTDKSLESIEVQFELYNINNIYILAAIVVVIIAGGGFIIWKNMKPKKKVEEVQPNPNENLLNQEQLFEQPITLDVNVQNTVGVDQNNSSVLQVVDSISTPEESVSDQSTIQVLNSQSIMSDSSQSVINNDVPVEQPTLQVFDAQPVMNEQPEPIINNTLEVEQPTLDIFNSQPTINEVPASESQPNMSPAPDASIEQNTDETEKLLSIEEDNNSNNNLL